MGTRPMVRPWRRILRLHVRNSDTVRNTSIGSRLVLGVGKAMPCDDAEPDGGVAPKGSDAERDLSHSQFHRSPRIHRGI